jgi:hypothetical protein
MPANFRYSRHAIEKMDGLGIERSDVESAVMRGMKWKDHDREIWHAIMAGTEVVFVKEKSAIVIVTVYRARREK